MCTACWTDLGSPLIENEGVLRAAAAVDALYEEHAAGGGMHIVTDDWNLEDEHVSFCRQWIAGHAGDVVERECLDAFAALSIHERASALALSGLYAFAQ